MAREINGHTSKDCKEMGFDGANGPLGCIPSMQVRRHKLVSDPPLFFHRRLIFLASFVIENLQINKQVSVFEMLHDYIVCSKAVFVLTGRKRFKQDDIGRVV